MVVEFTVILRTAVTRLCGLHASCVSVTRRATGTARRRRRRSRDERASWSPGLRRRRDPRGRMLRPAPAIRHGTRAAPPPADRRRLRRASAARVHWRRAPAEGERRGAACVARRNLLRPRRSTRNISSGPHDCKRRFDIRAVRFFPWRQLQLAPERRHVFIDREPRLCRRYFEEHAAGLAKVNRPEVAAVLHFGHLAAVANQFVA